MKTAELREKTDDELVELEASMSRDLWKSRFSNYSNQLDDTDKIRRLRRDIARVKTLRVERSKKMLRTSPAAGKTAEKNG